MSEAAFKRWQAVADTLLTSAACAARDRRGPHSPNLPSAPSPAPAGVKALLTSRPFQAWAKMLAVLSLALAATLTSMQYDPPPALNMAPVYGYIAATLCMSERAEATVSKARPRGRGAAAAAAPERGAGCAGRAPGLASAREGAGQAHAAPRWGPCHPRFRLHARMLRCRVRKHRGPRGARAALPSHTLPPRCLAGWSAPWSAAPWAWAS